MRTSLVVIGLVLGLVGAGAWAFVTAAASDCDTTPGEVGRALDPDVRDQCRLAQTITTGAVVAIGVGLVLTVAGLAAGSRA